MSSEKMQHCFNCGTELGVYQSGWGDIEACGEAECQREQRNAYRQRDEEAQYAAEQDEYNRYR